MLCLVNPICKAEPLRVKEISAALKTQGNFYYKCINDLLRSLYDAYHTAQRLKYFQQKTEKYDVVRHNPPHRMTTLSLSFHGTSVYIPTADGKET